MLSAEMQFFPFKVESLFLLKTYKTRSNGYDALPNQSFRFYSKIYFFVVVYIIQNNKSNRIVGKKFSSKLNAKKSDIIK